jgi:hypothetical protein
MTPKGLGVGFCALPTVVRVSVFWRINLVVPALVFRHVLRRYWNERLSFFSIVSLCHTSTQEPRYATSQPNKNLRRHNPCRNPANLVVRVIGV